MTRSLVEGKYIPPLSAESSRPGSRLRPSRRDADGRAGSYSSYPSPSGTQGLRPIALPAHKDPFRRPNGAKSDKLHELHRMQDMVEAHDMWRPGTSPASGHVPGELSSPRVRPTHFFQEHSDWLAPLSPRSDYTRLEIERSEFEMQKDALTQLHKDVMSTVVSPWENKRRVWGEPEMSKTGRMYPGYLKCLPDRKNQPADNTLPEAAMRLDKVEARLDRIEAETKAVREEFSPASARVRGFDVGLPAPTGKKLEALETKPDVDIATVAAKLDYEDAPTETNQETKDDAQVTTEDVEAISLEVSQINEKSSDKSKEDMDHDELLEALIDEAEMEALDQTLSPYFVLMSAEHDITAAAIAIARIEAQTSGIGVHVEGKSRKKSLIPQTQGHGTQLTSFIPGTLRRCIRNGLVHFDQWKILLEAPVKCTYDPILSRFDAVVVFADASGFTKLTESLAKQPNGAEMIGSTINGFFGPVLDLVHEYGGDVIKFSGDALTIIWPAEDPAPDPNSPHPRRISLDEQRERSRRTVIEELEVDVERKKAARTAMASAARFCIDVQEQIPSFGQTPVPGVNLTMHIGVGFGQLALLQLGGLLGRWEYCVAGVALDQISIAEPLAKSGETCFSPEARHLAPEFRFEDVESPDGHVGFALLQGVQGQRRLSSFDYDENYKVPAWWKPLDVTNSELKLVKRYIPSAVALRLASASEADTVTYPEEMRRVSVVFLSIGGLNPTAGPPEDDPFGVSGNRQTQLLMRLMQRSVYALEGSVNKFLVDDKGVLLLVCFGLPPLIHYTDDPIRAVLCGMRLTDTLWDEGLEGFVGVATGNCWCGVVGTERRREYTVLGDVVNLSARLMGKAEVNNVLVDSTTKEAADKVLEFGEPQEFVMKGKALPVTAYKYLRARKGLTQHRKELRMSLMNWNAWSAKSRLVEALDGFKRRSGVLVIQGPGGAGKTELAEQVCQWAMGNNRNLLTGQNLDPSGTFSLPRLCLQEAFRVLVELASKDHYWRKQGWDLLTASLGDKPNSPPSRCTSRASRMAEDSGLPADFNDRDMTKRSPGHAELYWMLIAMMQHSLGEEAASRLEPWAPLLSLVVTELAFGPRMVSAMMERNEQHVRLSRFAVLVSSVLDGFSKFGGTETNTGTVVLLHIRRSSAFFQTSDAQEQLAVQAIADICMRRREEAGPDGEKRPMLLVLVCRQSPLKDASTNARIAEAGARVDAEDLTLEETGNLINHLLCPEEETGASKRVSRCHTGRMSISRTPTQPLVGHSTSTDNSPLRSFKKLDVRTAEVISDYVQEVTGGNPLGVETLLKGMEKQDILRRSGNNQVTLSPFCKDSKWLRKEIQLPEILVGMAFSAFERLNPQEQMVLKAASTLEHEFTFREIRAALHGMISESEVLAIMEKLAIPSQRALRKSPKNRKAPNGERESVYLFYSGLLRHAAHSLVLETQRTEVRRKTMSAIGQLDLSVLRKVKTSNMDEIDEDEDDEDEDEEGMEDGSQCSEVATL